MTLLCADMEFVKNFTPLDFQAKNFTPLISLNFNKKTQKKLVKMEKFTPPGKNFTLPPAVTNLTSDSNHLKPQKDDLLPLQY